jgi:hypothetical protein
MLLWKGTRRAAFMAETLNVFGVFEDHKQAELALHELKRAGLRDDQLGFAVREHRSLQTDARERAAVVAGGVIAGLLAGAETLFLPLIGPSDLTSVLQSVLPVEERVEQVIEGRRDEEEASATEQPTSERPATGEAERRAIVVEADAAAGSLVGGFLGAAAALLIPGIGPVVAGGILLTPLVSAAVGALVGDVIGGLVAMGLPENAAQQYAREFEAGRTLVSVKADGPQQAQQALDILLRLGARDVQVH